MTSVDGQDVARFEVLTEDGGPAINQGLVFFDQGYLEAVHVEKVFHGAL